MTNTPPSLAHTPGPWTANEETIYSDQLRICFCFKDAWPWPDGIGKAECQANARLIAAAPDLLDSVQRLIPYAEQEAIDALAFAEENQAAVIFRCIDEAYVAIAKARCQ